MDLYIFPPTVLIELTILQELYLSPRTISSLNTPAMSITKESLEYLWSQVYHWFYYLQALLEAPKQDGIVDI